MAATLTTDPSLYEFYDCPRIDAERKRLTSQVEDTRKQMEKNETGVGGSIINEAVYQPDVIKQRGSLKRLDDAWRREKCTTPVSPTVGPAGKSKSAVY
jgi:hypothetical protein